MLSRKICHSCKTGVDTLRMGCTPVCPYLNCYTKGHCTQYVPINRYSKLSFFDDIIKKFKC